MFETISAIGEDFEKIILLDKASATRVEIVPACGAILHGFYVMHAGERLNIIDHYDNKADFAANVTSKGFKSCKLSPFACRIKDAHYHFGEKEYTIKKYLSGSNALHGLLYDAPFTITRQYTEEKGAGVSMEYQYRGEDAGYPFHYDCLVNYELHKDNKLTVTTEISNMDMGLIPVQDGWHPYFTFGSKIDELQLEFQAKEKIVFDEQLIPTGELLPYHAFDSLEKIGAAEFDNCFSMNFAECQPLCVLRDPAKKIQLEIYPGNQYPYLQIYTPPHRNSIAIENLSAPPDAFNNTMGLHILQPTEKINFTVTYKITSLI